MSDLLRIGASGVNAYRSALSVIGDNVANADTAGYVRRDVTLREAPAAGGSGPYYRGVVTGSGVNAVSVTRAWDAFKAESARSSAADAGRADARAQWLGAVETALPDDDSGISAKVTGFFSAATQLAADPTSTLARSTALSALGDAAGAIGSGATALGKVADGVAADAQSTVASVNGSLASLATLNQAIARTGAGTDTKASLEDQRDSLLDDLAAKIGIDADVAADGSVSVSLAGANGTTLVSGNRAATVALAVGGDGRLSLAIGGSGVAATGGKLAGLVDAANGVASTRASLDATAASFATQLNGWQAKGLNGNGAPGQPLLAIGAGAATLALATSDPAAIAAASADGTANGNLANLTDLRGSDGAEARLTALVNVNAQALASAKAESAAAGSRRDAALADRDDLSGVDLDREAAELLRYQQAYAGSAKVIQVARETLQSILSLF